MPSVGSTEIYRKLSSQISEQFPEFIREEGPNFVAFLKAYHEFMEQDGEVGDAQRALFDYQDIDRTLDDFIEHFTREFMDSIPREALVNKRLLVKHIKQFYRSRGSQDSFKFLFRAMFDEEIDIYYPAEDILRASDGRWVQETVLRGTTVSGNPSLLDGREVTGATSGARARVQEFLTITSAGIMVTQLKLESVSGEFLQDEAVSDGFGNSIRVFGASGSIQDVTILRGGLFHVVGDTVLLEGSSGGSATGTITATTDTSGVKWRIVNGGSGFRKANTVISISGGSPTVPSQFTIVNLSNTQNVSLNTDIINPMKNVVLNTLPFGAGGSPMATKNVYSTLSSALTFSSATVGSINTIALIDPGNYPGSTLPTANVVDSEVASQLFTDTERGNYKGRNASIIAERGYGGITSIRIDTSTLNFLKDDAITVTNTTRSSANTTDLSTDTYGGITRGLIRKGIYPASVTADIEGTFPISGRYTDTKGFLSWNNKLQDNEYYQAYSYVIRAKKLVDNYRSVVKKLVHPAGTKMFGVYRVDNGGDLNATVNCGSTGIVWKRSPNSQNMTITPATKKMTLSVGPFWLANGTLASGSNVFVVPISNTSGANGLYKANTIAANGKYMYFRLPYEHGSTTGRFYYVTSQKGNI